MRHRRARPTVADYYGWEDHGTWSCHSTARLSMTMAELAQDRVTGVRSRTGKPALFVTGVAEDIRAITDILTMPETGTGQHRPGSTTGVSSEIFRYLSLYPTDINSDGVTEVPVPVTLLPTAGERTVRSTARSTGATMTQRAMWTSVLTTYHDTGRRLVSGDA